MKKFHIRIVGGWCGNRMAMIEEFLQELLSEKGYTVRIDHQSIWESRAVCPTASLMLQLLPAFTEDEVHCPLLSIRAMSRDLDHEETLQQILDTLERIYPDELAGS